MFFQRPEAQLGECDSRRQSACRRVGKKQARPELASAGVSQIQQALEPNQVQSP